MAKYQEKDHHEHNSLDNDTRTRRVKEKNNKTPSNEIMSKLEVLIDKENGIIKVKNDGQGIVETIDKKRKQNYTQYYIDNMFNKKKPIIEEWKRVAELKQIKDLSPKRYMNPDGNKIEYLKLYREVYNIYFQHGPRSPKKVNYFHNFIKDKLMSFIDTDKFVVKLEQNVKTVNYSKRKKCDIVIYDKNTNEVKIILPAKIIMSSYHKNRNNYFENLTGEIFLLKKINPDVVIIPINVIPNTTPVLNNKNVIKSFETNNKTFDVYKKLKDLCGSDFMFNYIINVSYEEKIGDIFTKIPNIIDFSTETPFIDYEKINTYLNSD